MPVNNTTHHVKQNINIFYKLNKLTLISSLMMSGLVNVISSMLSTLGEFGLLKNINGKK